MAAVFTKLCSSFLRQYPKRSYTQTCALSTSSTNYNKDDEDEDRKIRHIYTAIGFHEKLRKGGYGLKMSKKEQILLNLKDIRNELAKLQHEVWSHLDQDRVYVGEGDRDVVWLFDSNKSNPKSGGHPSNPSQDATVINPITSTNRYHNSSESGSAFDGWVVTCDSTHDEGFSSASLTTSPAGHALFKGVLSTELPKDGVINRSGYCNMTAPRPMKSFGRDSYYDWSNYTHLVIRCRGDGRSYILAMGSAGDFDISWNDMYQYVLYTRGGPHWQTYKVPFSKFFLSSKGITQDKQCVIDPERVTSFGISVGDKINAPFKLEIDFIAVENDPTHVEEFAYELYQVPKFYVGY